MLLLLLDTPVDEEDDDDEEEEEEDGAGNAQNGCKVPAGQLQVTFVLLYVPPFRQLGMQPTE